MSGALEFYPPLPVPPTREEMEQAIVAWWAYRGGMGRPDSVLPPVQALLDLAERLAAWRAANASICSIAGRSAVLEG